MAYGAYLLHQGVKTNRRSARSDTPSDLFRKTVNAEVPLYKISILIADLEKSDH